MYIRVSSIRNRPFKRFLEHGIYLSIIFILIPVFYYFELCVVCPAIVEAWSVEHFIHLVCTTFILLNIVGNLIYGMFTDSSIKAKCMNAVDTHNWTECVDCELLRPPRAWHCEICNVCILKRDHHCTYLACCVGYFNYRYFIMLTFYVFIAMVYAFYFNVKFLALSLTWNNGLVILKFVFPIASFFIGFDHDSTYAILVVINFVVALFTGFLLYYHFKNILKGRTTPEIKHNAKDISYNKGWKSNLVEVFGYRWYLAWILPFIYSPLPGNGMEWVVNNKYN